MAGLARPAANFIRFQNAIRAVRGLYRDFYTLPSIFARLPLPLSEASVASWVLNLTQRRVARRFSNFGNF